MAIASRPSRERHDEGDGNVEIPAHLTRLLVTYGKGKYGF